MGLHAKPTLLVNWTLALIPCVILLSLYFSQSAKRLADNPQDKILPSLGQMVNAVDMMAFTPDKRTGEYLLWKDTLSSLRRMAIGIHVAAFIGLFLGLNMGMLPLLRGVMLPLVTFISIIPPLAILPILFIAFGVDELAKVMLILIGVCPVITRDIYHETSKIPREQITKALSLGATQFEVVYRIVLPQIKPALFDAIRLTLGAAWMFLIASEAIASSDGLGYRIFLVRRYLSMDVIIPYTIWITLIGFGIDFSLRKFVEWRYRWYVETR
ncbi:MAG: ABC transporter permease [Deltaproteobacteria bacterium]|nr:ABC transporter permease [Deltaproteobacteria bacterium]